MSKPKSPAPGPEREAAEAAKPAASPAPEAHLSPEQVARLEAIEARLNAIGRPDWVSRTANGDRYYPPANPSVPQRAFMAHAPKDVAYLLDLIEALTEAA